MARSINKLSDRGVKAKKEPGYYGDGAGLWLQVSKTSSKSWVFRYTKNRRTHDIGLGSALNVSLALAREKAAELRAALGRGDDPMSGRLAAKAQAASRMTFAECAEKFIEANRAGWKNPKHADQWENTLKTYAYPVIGRLDVSNIDTDHVIKILEPIWMERNETASRLRQRVERVLSWSTTRNLRTGENPARWKGHLDTLLPRPSAVQKTTKTHHAALPYQDAPAFVQSVRAQPGVAPRALEFTILTVARTSEVIGATWEEIDFDQAVWTVPSRRMKANKEHRVPLPARALEILHEMEKQPRNGNHIFPGWGEKSHLSNMAMLKLLGRMGRDDLTVHGFRSTFRDWAGETTHHPREVIEHALAHQLRDKAEVSYARGTLFEKRRALMNDWASFIESAA